MIAIENQVQTIPSLTGLCQTAWQPAYIRAQETLMGDRILKDLKAVEMMKKLDLPKPSILNPLSQLSSILLTRLFDFAVMHFLEASPNGVVINLGAGFCSRFDRLNAQQVTWYDIDFEEIAQIRSSFFDSHPRYHWISGSFLDNQWISNIEIQPDQDILIVMEGVSMYLKESDLKFLLQKLRQHFPNAEMLMDVISTECLWHKSLESLFAIPIEDIRWSLKDSYQLEQWDIGIQIVEENYYLSYLKHFPARLNYLNKAWVLPSLPLVKNSGRLLRLNLQSRCPP